MVGEDKRHLMQNLFGDQSEEEDEELESEHESNRQPNYASDEEGFGLKSEAEDVVEGQGEAYIGSDGELHEIDHNHIESQGERDQNSQEVDLGDQRAESEGNDSRSDQREDYGHRVATSRRRDVVESESERSEENHYVGTENQEGDHARSPSVYKDKAHISQTAHELREVFGDSDDEQVAEYNAVQTHPEDKSNRSPMNKEGYENDLRPDDVLADEEGHNYSEEDNIEIKTKEKAVGPPLELEIPMRPPPSTPEKMNMIKVSNIMGIDPKPFDPKTFVEEDSIIADESGHNKRIRLENNIVRYRAVRNPDGTKSYESNARFIRWSDGSLQLQIGNEVLDISVQDAQHDQAQLFLRHEKGILQSQGRVLRKMRFMPSSLSSNSHRLLTALVDSRHKKSYRVKNCVTAIDPEREKEQKEKAESQTIRANELLSRKKEKVNRKYTNTLRRERQLSPGFLEDALDEDDEPDYYETRRSAARRRFEEELEMEARAEKRIINAKRSQGHKNAPRKSSVPPMKSSRRPVTNYESEKEESEYETEVEEDERSPQRYDDEEEDHSKEAMADEESEEEAKFKHKASGVRKKHKEIESDDDSPPRKATSHRRKALVYVSDED